MARRLASVPDAPLRAVAYIRQSRTHDDSISPELQRTAINDYCASRGYVVVDTLTDLDMTGRLWTRRSIEQAVQMIESGGADVIVTWKWSRVARNRKDWAVAVDRIEGVGGRLESATESVDATTSTGRFTRGMLAELAAFESDRIGDVWREVQARRIKAGLPAHGKPRFGYRPGVPFTIDPETGPVLADLYRRYTAGESIDSLVSWLNTNGWPTVRGYVADWRGQWSKQTLRYTLDSGFGAGLLCVKGEHLPGAHEPVITEGEWVSYQAARDSRRQRRRGDVSPYPLSGLVVCRCGAPMWAQCDSKRNRWRCSAPVRHPDASIGMAPVEAAVLDWLRTDAAAEVTSNADADLARESHNARRKIDAENLAREITALDRQLADLTMHLTSGLVPPAAYAAARDQITGQRDILARRMKQAEADGVATRPRRLAADLLADWDILDVERRREMLRQLLRHVEVTAGREPVITPVPVWDV